MKLILLVACMFFAAAGFCQTAHVTSARIDSLSKAAREERMRQFAKDSAARAAQIAIARKRKSDSLIIVIQPALNITKEKATAVMQVIDASINAMDENARNRGITVEEKTNRFKAIAKERDDKIATLLTEEQIKQLKEITKRNRPQVKEAVAPPMPARQ